MTTHKIVSTEAEQFFYDHAGYSHRVDEPATSGRARCAISLAEAEAIAESRGWEVGWEEDPEPFDCDCGSSECGNYQPYCASLRDSDGNVLASLCGVTFATDTPNGDPYARVVAAELASEALWQS